MSFLWVKVIKAKEIESPHTDKSFSALVSVKIKHFDDFQTTLEKHDTPVSKDCRWNTVLKFKYD